VSVSLPPFQHVVDDLGPSLRRHVAALVGATDADDVVQEALLSALRAYPSLSPDANVRAWLWTIARNKAIDGHRRRSRRPQTTAWPDGDLPVPANDGGVVGGDDDLWERVRLLPEGQRLAVTLRFVDDLSYAQIAEHCGCSAGAARQRVYEGLQALREEVTR
jgi:DNA-directed RNA polymerase specialized sigma24 family protein